MTARDDAANAGQAAAAILTTAQRRIIAVMDVEGARAIHDRLSPQLAKRRFANAAAVELGRASAALRPVYARAVRDVTGKDGPLPDAPAQLDAAVLRAQQDAETAFGAVLAAALGPGNGVRMPSPSSPYRRITDSARRQPTPGKAAAAALDAITARGLTGWVSYSGRRWTLADYGGKVVKAATMHTARMPALPEITGRRDALLAVHARAVSGAWGKAVQGLDVPAAVAAFRSDSRLASAAGNLAVAARWRKEAAQSAAAGLLGGVYRSGGWAGFQGALERMAADGMAEGEADALLLAATKQHVAGFSAGAAFTDALSRLQGDMAVPRQAQDAAAQITAGAAADVARALAASRDDEDEDDAAEDAGEALKAGVARRADYALWAALGAGAVALYRRLGGFGGAAVGVDWIASASACPLCQQNAAGSPYAPADVPAYPGHNACRCILAGTGDIPLSMLAQFAGLL